MAAQIRRLGVAFALIASVAAVTWWLRPPARVAWIGGPILTMDAVNRVAGGFAIDGDRIAAVGSEAEILAWAERARARVVDLGGRAVLPGFGDAHSHFPGAGATRSLWT